MDVTIGLAAEDASSDFGSWLRARRKAFDLTQEELGRKLGYSGDAIRKVEMGARRPSRQMALLFADWLRVPSSQRKAFLLFARAKDEEA